MDEQYIYLGFQINTHFFLHMIADPGFDEVTSDQIYNTMMHESRIVDPGVNVIIYEISPQTGNVYVTSIQHQDKDEYTTFEEANLESFFGTLMNAPRSDMYIIKYNREKGCYETFELDIDLIRQHAGLLPLTEMSINNIRYVITSKPFE